jgi:hypothetical protein
MKLLAPIGLLLASTVMASPALAQLAFTPGDLVVSVEGAGVVGATSGPYTDNQAAPLSLFEYLDSGTSSATYVGSDVLPQSSSGTNSAISGEYGSSSEGILQLTGNGEYLTIMGYGVNAAAFNADPTAYGEVDPTNPNALAQSSSIQSSSYTAVPRVVALIGADGSADTSTALYGVFNGNNPRSVYSVDGSSFYVSGQGNSPDATGGVFYATKGASSATAITGLDTNSKTSAQDTRVVEVYNNQLYVSADSTEGKGSNRDFIGTLGSAGSLPTGLANSGNGPTQIPESTVTSSGKYTITTATTNGLNVAGEQVNLSPEEYFFANATTLYVADSGAPKNTSATNALGDGGLQKWTFNGSNWVLDYTLAAGLNLVANANANSADTSGTTGLLGLTGKVVGGIVQLYATNYTIGDTDQTYLYGINDVLADTTEPTGESFTQLAAAPADSSFKGVAFAPQVVSAAPEPTTWMLLFAGVGLVGAMMRADRRRPRPALSYV